MHKVQCYISEGPLHNNLLLTLILYCTANVTANSGAGLPLVDYKLFTSISHQYNYACECSSTVYIILTFRNNTRNMVMSAVVHVVVIK